jgi:hypothetical protein
VTDAKRQRGLFGWLLLATTILALPYVYAAAFTGVELYDDEGTLMITFREIMEGQRLYDDEYALYGPFYYISIGGLFTTLHLPLSHDVVRLVSAAFWLACTIALSALVYRMTRSLVASGLAYVTALLLLKPFTSSPTHPEEICVLLLVWLPHLLCGIERRPAPAALAAIGTIVSAMMLTKLNVGIFVAIALALVAIRATRLQTWVSSTFAGMAVVGAVLPFVLMLPLLRYTWVVTYCAFATATIAIAIMVWWRVEVPEMLTLWHWIFCILTVAATGVVITGIVVLAGTTPYAIFNTTVLQNLHNVQNWYSETHLDSRAAISALTAVATAVGYVFFSARSATRDLAQRAVLWLKLSVGLAGIAVVIYFALYRVPWLAREFLFKVLMPFCWLLIVPPVMGRTGVPVVRGGIGLLAALMVLYPFPVSGTQLSCAVLLPAVMLPVLVHDAVTGLNVLSASRRSVMPGWGLGAALLAGLALGAMLFRPTRDAVNEYASATPLGLPGASLIHVSADTADTYHWVTQELSRCGSFYTMPGQLSFYFWTRQPTPTGLNTNDSLGLLTRSQQERVVADLAARPDLCVLRASRLEQFYDRGQIARHPSLLVYIDEMFAPFAERGPYKLLKRKESPN